MESDKKDTSISYIKDDTDAVLIFYKSTPTTDEVTGSRYIEIFTHLKKPHDFWRHFSGYETLTFTLSLAAKCDYVCRRHSRSAQLSDS
jgi:mRNA deadenylase 3'-5' endonuclease subunit Ccr4